jgi:DNA-binding transcriptional MerR regulator
VYGISVASELVDMAPQALRLYESRGLVTPERTAGGTRRYSEADLARIRRIGELLGRGLNLAGVALVLGLEAENADLEARNANLGGQNAALRARLASRNAAPGTRNGIPSGQGAERGSEPGGRPGSG